MCGRFVNPSEVLSIYIAFQALDHLKLFTYNNFFYRDIKSGAIAHKLITSFGRASSHDDQ